MVRLLFILILVATLAVIVFILATMVHQIYTAGTDRLRPAMGSNKDADGGFDVASSGIQKAAYVALIVVLFGAASGWLGSL